MPIVSFRYIFKLDSEEVKDIRVAIFTKKLNISRPSTQRCLQKNSRQCDLVGCTRITCRAKVETRLNQVKMPTTQPEFCSSNLILPVTTELGIINPAECHTSTLAGGKGGGGDKNK